MPERKVYKYERDSDIVKRIHEKNDETPFFLISLIEHKSNVDYNVVMQMFRYIAFIWADYEKEMEKKHEGISKTKGFRYPPILPILFYDGPDNWTAATKMHDRVLLSDVLGEYIPNEEVDAFTAQIKERKMGELLAHFKGWDVQAARREGREEAWKEAREEDVMKLIRIIKKLGCTEETAKQQLIDEYELSREEAAEKVEMYWQS